MSLSYRADIDGLRAIAILLVVAFHAFPSAVPGGFIGVDVFFVISGYLITHILQQEIQSGTWSLANFYARRVLRIFPALVLVIFVFLLAGWYTLLAPEYKQLGKHVGLGAAFLSNFGLWFEAGYFDKVSEAKPLLHLWSLAIEEQFYIAWPLLLWGLLRIRKGAFGLVICLAAISLMLSIWWVWRDPTQAFYSPASRAWELLAGAILALQGGNRSRDVPVLVRAIAVTALIGGALFLNSEIPFPGLVALLPVLATIVLLVSPARRDVIGGMLGHPFMVAIGKVSYPWYLWHWPLLSFAYIFESGHASASLRGGLVLLSLLLAILTYRLWELPIRRVPRRWAVLILLLMMMLTGLLGKNIFDRDGLERIRHKDLIALDDSVGVDFLDFEKQGLITEAECEKPFLFPERNVCLIANVGQPVSAVVLGDSHAVHAFWGLTKAFNERGLNLAVRGKGACVPFLPSRSPPGSSECDLHMDFTLHDISKNKAIREVALVFRGRYLEADTTLGAKEAFEARLHETLRLLSDAGKRIYYFLPVVEPGFDPRLCSGSLPIGRKPPYSCVIDKGLDDAKSVSVRISALRVLQHFPEVVLVDPNMALCVRNECPVIQNGHSIFKDDNHLSRAGSFMLSNTLKSE